MKTFLLGFFSVFSGIMVVSSYHPVYSVLWLVLAFLGAAGVFLLYELDFLALVLVIVYVGAIATLFLFVIMMLDLSDLDGWEDESYNYLAVASMAGGIFATELLGLQARCAAPLWSWSSNLAVLGQLLYTEFYYLFLLASLVLLAAMVGAIILVGGFEFPNKVQDLFSQVSRHRR